MKKIVLITSILTTLFLGKQAHADCIKSLESSDEGAFQGGKYYDTYNKPYNPGIHLLENKNDYFYAGQAKSCTLVILGIANGQKPSSYCNISRAIQKYGYNVAIIDQAPGNFLNGYPDKIDPTDYANMANSEITAFKNRNHCGEIHLILGGHGEGGFSAHEAIKRNLINYPVSGYVGLEPMNMNQASYPTGLPAVYWGVVKVKGQSITPVSASLGYEGFTKDSAPAYYFGMYNAMTLKKQIENKKKKKAFQPIYYSNNFLDKGCNLKVAAPFCKNAVQIVYNSVAKSIHNLLKHGSEVQKQDINNSIPPMLSGISKAKYTNENGTTVVDPKNADLTLTIYFKQKKLDENH